MKHDSSHRMPRHLPSFSQQAVLQRQSSVQRLLDDVAVQIATRLREHQKTGFLQSGIELQNKRRSGRH